MDKIEILHNERTLEEVKNFSNYFIGQSNLNIRSTPNGSAFLTSLLVGAGLVSTYEISAKSFEFAETTKNHITSTLKYGKEVNNDMIRYINDINIITRKTITKHSLIKNILSFKSLKESWDGYGSLPLEIDSASNAIRLMDFVGENIFCTVNEFYPNTNGTITFEWTNTENEIVSVEVGNHSFSYFVEMASMETVFFNNKTINAKEAKMLAKYIQAI